jgi:hypothetical protein
MEQSTNNVSSLSKTARMKGKALFYLFVLSPVLTIADHIYYEKQFNPLIFGFIFVSVIAIYRFRPSSIQSLIDKWALLNNFPLKKGSPKVFLICLGLVLILNILDLLPGRQITWQNIHSMLFYITAIVFLLDKEIANFIWKQPSKV